MAEDIRVTLSLRTHRKKVAVARRLHSHFGQRVPSELAGLVAESMLTRLWAAVAESTAVATGKLTGWSVSAIADALSLPESFSEQDGVAIVEAMITAGFIDRGDGGELAVHQWEEHQGWLRSEDDRKRHGRMMSHKRYRPHCADPDCEFRCVDSRKDASSMLPASSEACPYPVLSNPTHTVPDQSLPTQPEPDRKESPASRGQRRIAARFAEDSVQTQLVREFFEEHVRRLDPKHPEPDVQAWAGHFDKLIRLDKRGPDEIRKVIRFVQADPFWSSNILSPKKLREKFSVLTAKMNGKGGAHVGNDRHDGFGSEFDIH